MNSSAAPQAPLYRQLRLRAYFRKASFRSVGFRQLLTLQSPHIVIHGEDLQQPLLAHVMGVVEDGSQARQHGFGILVQVERVKPEVIQSPGLHGMRDTSLSFQHAAGHRNHPAHSVAGDEKMIVGDILESRKSFFHSYGPGSKREQLIEEVHGFLKHSVVGADQGRLRSAIRPQSETLEDIEMIDLVPGKHETLQQDPLLSSYFNRGVQISQSDGGSTFRIPIIDMAE